VVNNARVYIKTNLNEVVEGVAGFPDVRSFRGEGDLARRAYLNRPQGCAVDSRGNLVFADVWNMRIRTISGLIQDCAHARREVPQQELDVYVRLQQVADQTCSSTPRLAALTQTMQQQVSDQLDTSLYDSHFCRFGNTSDPYLTGNNTDHTRTLCGVCREVQAAGSWPDSPLCPWQETCSCHDALLEVISSPGFQSCPEVNAYYDRWNRWASAYAGCLAKTQTEALANAGQPRLDLMEAVRDSVVV